MIKIHSLTFDTFPAIESLNPDFRPNHPKMRVVVDAEADSGVPDAALHDRLSDAFPALLQHRCRASESSKSDGNPPRGIVLLEADSSANQAHLLEHVMLEILRQTDSGTRWSGVTCAYKSPPERNDVFVECADRDWGAFAANLGVEIVNRALDDDALAPLYPDTIRCARLASAEPATSWSIPALARAAGIPSSQAADAIDAAARAGIVRTVPYSMNFSGVPVYRAQAHA